MKTKYLHTMIRVRDLDATVAWFQDFLGLEETRRYENEAGRFTLVFLAPPGQHDAPVELTYNWGSEEAYDHGRAFGHLAYGVEDIYASCQKMLDAGVIIHRPPRDGRMAFVKTPDGISVELLQIGEPLPKAEPWASMENTGSW
ncbi:MAG: VOC family protein [Pseudomonadota bacterium]